MIQELIGIIKHELCHYHLHLEGQGDTDTVIWELKALLKKWGSGQDSVGKLPERNQKRRSLKKSSYINAVNAILNIREKEAIDTARYVCGKCRGKLIKLGEMTC